jgi:outer membrane protein OmpA-like peptidoglycan-associated protein
LQISKDKDIAASKNKVIVLNSEKAEIDKLTGVYQNFHNKNGAAIEKYITQQQTLKLLEKDRLQKTIDDLTQTQYVEPFQFNANDYIFTYNGGGTVNGYGKILSVSYNDPATSCQMYITIANGNLSFDFSKINMVTEMPKEILLPKDAPVNVTITDFNGRPLPNEIMVFKGRKKQIEYQSLTNDQGQFSTRLPAGDVYQIYILGFKDSASIDSIVIPAQEGRKYYKNPFAISYKFLPAKSFVLENCNFDNGKATLQDSSFKVLDELVAYLVRKDDEKIEIGGHTDIVGSATSNLKLSQDRANSVRDYLISKGIDASRITAKGYGITKPIADNKKAAGRAENRRTEVTILE